MTAITYDHSPAHVRDGITAAQERAWKRIASAGVWLDGERRVAIAAETRNAPGCKLCAARKEALSPYSVDGAHDNLGALPDDVVEVIHRIATDPGRLMQRWYDEIIAAGLADTDYVETVGVVVTIVSIDTFARALGVAPLALPDPVAGAPSRKRPAGAKHGGAWVPWIAPEDLTQDETDMGLYAGGPAAHIRRALSLVPAEALGFFDLVENQYLEGRQMRDFGNEFRAITHGQIELIAARISALNQCVY